MPGGPRLEGSALGDLGDLGPEVPGVGSPDLGDLGPEVPGLRDRRSPRSGGLGDLGPEVPGLRDRRSIIMLGTIRSPVAVLGVLTESVAVRLFIGVPARYRFNMRIVEYN